MEDNTHLIEAEQAAVAVVVSQQDMGSLVNMQTAESLVQLFCMKYLLSTQSGICLAALRD